MPATGFVAVEQVVEVDFNLFLIILLVANSFLWITFNVSGSSLNDEVDCRRGSGGTGGTGEVFQAADDSDCVPSNIVAWGT